MLRTFAPHSHLYLFVHVCRYVHWFVYLCCMLFASSDFLNVVSTIYPASDGVMDSFWFLNPKTRRKKCIMCSYAGFCVCGRILIVRYLFFFLFVCYCSGGRQF